MRNGRDDLAAATEDSVWVTDAAGDRILRVGPEGIRGATDLPTDRRRAELTAVFPIALLQAS